MIRGLRIINYLNQSVVVRTDFPASENVRSLSVGNKSIEQGPFLLYSIDGLDPGEANITSTELATMDGAVFNSARRTSKELTFTFLLNETGSPYQGSTYAANGLTIQSAKDKVRQYFPLKSKVKIIFCQDNNPIQYASDFKKYNYYLTEGYVKTINYDTFSKMCAASITVLMPDPYFYFMLSLDNFNPLGIPMEYSEFNPYTKETTSSVYNPSSLDYGIDHAYAAPAELFYNDVDDHIFYNIIIPISKNISSSDISSHKYWICFSNGYKELSATYRPDNKPRLKLDLTVLLSYETFSSRGLLNGDIITVSSLPGKRDVGIRLSGTTTDISINAVLSIDGEWPYINEANGNVYGAVTDTDDPFFLPISEAINSSGFSIKYNYKRSGL